MSAKVGKSGSARRYNNFSFLLKHQSTALQRTERGFDYQPHLFTLTLPYKSSVEYLMKPCLETIDSK